ncbi:MAG: cation-transporting ATPase, partial [Candidatus Saccharimonas aalborgensis]
MDILKLDYMTSGTIAVIMATAIAISLVFQSSRMLGVKITRRTASARLFYVVWASLVVFLAFGFQFSRSFFDFNHPASNRLHELWPILLVLAITLLVHYLFARLAGTRIRKDNTAM